MRPALLFSILVIAPASAHADDRIVFGWVGSPPITEDATKITHAVAARWDRRWWPAVEIGFGVELAVSEGRDRLTTFAMLPGIAYARDVGSIELRIEAQGGWQIATGRLTLDGLPLQGTETRGFHTELAFGLDAKLNDVLDVRARAGIVTDGIYPAGHVLTRTAPFIGLALVVRL